MQATSFFGWRQRNSTLLEHTEIVVRANRAIGHSPSGEFALRPVD